MNTNSPTMPDTGAASLSKKSSLSKNILRLAIIQALACSSTALYAAPITVNSLDDAVTDDGNCTLREAISASATGAVVDNCAAGEGTDTINFDNSLSGSTITLAGSQLLIQTNLTIDGDLDNDGTADITIDANNLSRVIQISADGPDISVTLEGLTITGGNRTEGFGTIGGGIFISEYDNLTLSNSTVTGNIAGSNGGGISAGFGNVTLTDSTVSNNTSGNDGGGISAGYGNITLTDSTISGNTTTGSGGAIYSGGYSTLNLTNSTLSGNTTSNGAGGAIYAGYGASTNLTNSTLSGNTSDAPGGAIYTGYNSSLNLTNSTLSGNTSNAPGGAIFSSGSLTLTGSTISNNTAIDSFGGGIASMANYSSINLTNSTISGNTATNYTNGGGIYIYGYDTSLNISNSTITENTAGAGGGLFMYQSLSFTIVNSIFANNTQPNGTIEDCRGGGTATVTNNLMTDNGANCAFTPMLNVNPQLGALADNGGPTQTHMPLAGSPVLDAGDNTSCTATDQRNVARDDGSCDIGAVEGTTSTVLTSVQFDSSTATVSEDGTSITLNLTRSGGTTNEISVDYTTSDGTATAPADYTANMNTLNFAAGIISQSITIDITDDTDIESDEDFSVTLSNAQSVSGGGIIEIGDNASATVTITDDDTDTGTDPGTDTGTDTDTDTPASTDSSSPLALSPWWMLLGFMGLLRRKFKS